MQGHWLKAVNDAATGGGLTARPYNHYAPDGLVAISRVPEPFNWLTPPNVTRLVAE